MKGVVLQDVTKDELLNAIRETTGNEFLVLMTSAEVSALLGVSLKTVAAMKNDGRLTDYSTNNSYRKFSAKQVLELKRENGYRRRN